MRVASLSHPTPFLLATYPVKKIRTSPNASIPRHKIVSVLVLGIMVGSTVVWAGVFSVAPSETLLSISSKSLAALVMLSFSPRVSGLIDRIIKIKF
jgi:hypothetical protein